MPDMVIGIVAIVFGYKIISELIGLKRVKLESRASSPPSVRERIIDPPMGSQEDASLLAARAENLTRRLATLEEIIAADRRG